ncbi:GyrI-like domain-containing protein [Rhabdobacter roseus]|uniref:GyrI-like small molecule binding domain-containing protein n=1 Tax=Rhabdobacter roseus TaxID=1655419 RepID=A0A840U113_9BACT|nr:GyrI-like domain-containing protein [Rhabdobacter roseus]MBB5286068.1 hypothetical protein [Rhabdobacter roseus]
MNKLDLTKYYKSYYTAKPIPELVEVEPARFLSILGEGDPSEPAFAEHIQALYSTAYTLKFALKAQGQDFGVPKLEGQWWFDEEKYLEVSGQQVPLRVSRSDWKYRLLIRMPDFVTAEDLEAARRVVLAKKKVPLAEAVTLHEMAEGTCIQMLHLGPFATEPESLQQILRFAQEHRLAKNGPHHEIYLSDFTKTPPEKLKTILREPVKVPTS